MSMIRTGSPIILALIACLAAPSTGRGEDGIPWTGHLKAGDLATSRTNGFVSAMPGGRFVVTVAHLGPSSDDGAVRGAAPSCRSIGFRVDRLTVQRADGTVGVELGADQSIAPGQALQVVHDVDPSSGAGLPAWDLDLMGFRLKTDPAASRCGVVASAQFFPDAGTSTPVPVALMPNVGPSPRLGAAGGR